MLKKRIIPCLDIKDGRTVKGTNFVNLRDAGDPVALAERYNQEGADELVFLDISASLENRQTLVNLVSEVGKAINIPFAVGGGINDLHIAYKLLQNGADKISVNSAGLKNPALITEIAMAFGEQCLIVAIDARYLDGKWIVHSHGGTRPNERLLFEWAREVQELGAGEILFTSMDHDGTKNGFAIEALKKMNQMLHIPIVASGGAGTIQHFVDVFEQTDVSAALAASVFHFQEIEIVTLKDQLSKSGIPVRRSM
ncbi:MAG: imidazole glycerol phosphate synthase subunit HisF [Saprospiraceae bacterium]|nr:imidazole glycerol phosphate synthase subunit HisF [Saprospiraceae bacterium]